MTRRVQLERMRREAHDQTCRLPRPPTTSEVWKRLDRALPSWQKPGCPPRLTPTSSPTNPGSPAPGMTQNERKPQPKNASESRRTGPADGSGTREQYQAPYSPRLRDPRHARRSGSDFSSARRTGSDHQYDVGAQRALESWVGRLIEADRAGVDFRLIGKPIETENGMIRNTTART